MTDRIDRRAWLKLAGGAFAAPLAGGAFAAPLAAAEAIPDHPSRLEYPPLDFEPPSPDEYRRELPNGAVAFLVEDHQLPLVSVGVQLRVGGYLVPDELTGLAGFTGSQIRSGGTTSLSPREFDEEAAFLATNLSSSIGDTSGSASVDCLASTLDRSLELFFDMLKNPGFDEQRFQIAIAQTMQSLERRNDDVGAIMGREYRRLMRGDHFTARSTTAASIEAITIERMREFHARYYHPSSLIFAVSGDFDTEEMVDRLSAAVDSGDWPATAKPELPEIPVPEYSVDPGVYMMQKDGVNQSHIRMGHAGIERSNPDHIAVAVMNDILGGGGFISRIMSRVRSDEGLAYSAGSSFRAGTYYPGTFTAAFQSQNPKCAEATSIVIEEVERMRQEKVSEEELQTSKSQAIEVFPRYFATAGQIAGTFAGDELTGREKDYWAKYRDRVSAVTVDKIERVAQEYLMPEKLAILGVGAVDEMLAGNPDKPQYSFEKIAGDHGVERIPLPDPVTMEYPEG